MKSIQRILVAVDFSEPSAASVRYAARLARDLDAELLLVNVIDQRDLFCMEKIADRAEDFSVERYLTEMIRERESLFRDLIRQTNGSGLSVKTHIRMGTPHDELLKAIEEKSPDLLVMAAKGKGNLMDTLSGSCAQKLLRQSPVPVLSVR